MSGIVTRYQHITGADYSRVFITPFTSKKVVYVTNALAVGLLQVYVRPEGTESSILNETILNTQLLNANLLATNNLTLTNNCIIEYDEDAKLYRIDFGSNFANTNYSITLVGVSARSWSYETKTVSGFVINSNANTAFTDEVSWTATVVGEGV